MVASRSKRTGTTKKKPADSFTLPTGRNVPDDNPWHYAYLVTGEKKIGKTSFAIAGCEEFVLQFDKPNSAKKIREEMIDSWKHSLKVIKTLESLEKAGKFPYNRIIIDGVNEWYTMCQRFVCEEFDVSHPSEIKWAQGWHKLRDDFRDVVNRLLRLQIKTKSGLVFIAHASWKETKTHSGEDIEKLIPDLPPTCEGIVNGKCDAWISLEKDRDKRVIVVNGGEESDVGHRIDEHFLTPGGERIKEVLMGDSANEAMSNFIDAFNNKQTYISYKELRLAEKKSKASKPSTRNRRSTK